MKTAEDIIKDQKHELVTVSPETTIKNALKIMTRENIGAVLVTEGNKKVGIWTERDLMRNTLAEGFNPETAKIRDFMTTKLHYAEHNENILQLQDKFLGLRIRHLLIRKNGKFLGMVSSGDVTRHGLNQESEELRKLNKMMSWDYYENWRW